MSLHGERMKAFSGCLREFNSKLQQQQMSNIIRKHIQKPANTIVIASKVFKLRGGGIYTASFALDIGERLGELWACADGTVVHVLLDGPSPDRATIITNTSLIQCRLNPTITWPESLREGFTTPMNSKLLAIVRLYILRGAAPQKPLNITEIVFPDVDVMVTALKMYELEDAEATEISPIVEDPQCPVEQESGAQPHKQQVRSVKAMQHITGSTKIAHHRAHNRRDVSGDAALRRPTKTSANSSGVKGTSSNTNTRRTTRSYVQSASYASIESQEVATTSLSQRAILKALKHGTLPPSGTSSTKTPSRTTQSHVQNTSYASIESLNVAIASVLQKTTLKALRHGTRVPSGMSIIPGLDHFQFRKHKDPDYMSIRLVIGEIYYDCEDCEVVCDLLTELKQVTKKSKKFVSPSFVFAIGKPVDRERRQKYFSELTDLVKDNSRLEDLAYDVLATKLQNGTAKLRPLFRPFGNRQNLLYALMKYGYILAAESPDYDFDEHFMVDTKSFRADLLKVCEVLDDVEHPIRRFGKGLPTLPKAIKKGRENFVALEVAADAKEKGLYDLDDIPEEQLRGIERIPVARNVSRGRQDRTGNEDTKEMEGSEDQPGVLAPPADNDDGTERDQPRKKKRRLDPRPSDVESGHVSVGSS